MAKKYKCPYCEERLIRKDLIDHIDKEHEELIPEGFVSAQIVYDLVNGTKGHGRCRVCGKPTKWNKSAGRYDVLCDNPKCKEHMREEYKKNMLKVYGTYNILESDEQQKKMLANRSISGKYKFSDGGILTYTGSYERKFLEFADKVMQIPSKDIMAPGPTLEYEMDDKKHFYITDFLYIPYNAIIEIKDGGSNPNTKNSDGMKSSRLRTMRKEELITNNGTYNYLRLTDNNFVQLLEFFMDIKKALLEGNDDKIIKINESYIEESTKSTIDANYKPKGKKNLSSFEKVHITESVINKYKKEYPFLSHVRCKDTKEYICDGYIWFDDNELVAMVGSCEYRDDKTKWVVSLEITKKYRGYGLSKQILDYAVKTMNCKYLSVNKNNKVAKKVYDDYGFKVYQEDDTMYYMTIDKNIKELFINENLILNKKDLEINLDKFESGDSNILLVTGFSGSGKSTLAKSLATKYNADNYELDCLGFYLRGYLSREDVVGNEDGLVAFIDKKKLTENKSISNKEEVSLYREYIKFLINWCKRQKDKKFIIEGLQIYEVYEDGDTFITSCPMIIKGTSGLVSAIRAAKRNDSSFIEEFGPLVKWALKDNKLLNKLKKGMNESTIINVRDLYPTNTEQIMESIQTYITEKCSYINDKGEKVPEVCPKCGSKVGVYLRGEPVYLCSNCNKFFGVVQFKSKKESTCLQESKNIFTKRDFVRHDIPLSEIAEKHINEAFKSVIHTIKWCRMDCWSFVEIYEYNKPRMINNTSFAAGKIRNENAIDEIVKTINGNNHFSYGKYSASVNDDCELIITIDELYYYTDSVKEAATNLYSVKESSNNDLTKFNAYHLEIVRKGFNKDPKYHGWDEELYSKTIEFAINNDIKGNYHAKNLDTVEAYVYTAGEDLVPIYLGIITVYKYGDSYDWEWSEQEPISDEVINSLREKPMVESTCIDNFYIDD